MLPVITIVTLFLQASLAHAQPADYTAWRDACAELPANRELNGKPADKALLPIATFAEFDKSAGGITEQGPPRVPPPAASARGGWMA